ncbi:hypothetical protein ACEPPN_000613 [Leptodophora sp. 'Broadleaf-Isolate-01']
MVLSWPYRAHSHTPYWGETNAQANFCEEDYILTPYIAEFINTLTNITYLIYAFHGIRNNANRKDAVWRNLPYLGIAAVGFGSAIFHATMKNYAQWCDDLSMLVAVATVVHRVFTFDKPLSTTVITGAAIVGTMTVFSAWHCITDEITMHSVLFAVMIVIVGLKTRSIISMRVKDLIVAKEVRKLATWGGVIALVEYLTSDEAGQPLGGKFAWPVNLIVDGRAGDARLMSVNSSDHAKSKTRRNEQTSWNGNKIS